MSIQTATSHFQFALEDAKNNLESSQKAVTHWTSQVTSINAAMEAIKGILPAEAFSTEPLPVKGAKAGTKKAVQKDGSKRALPNLPEEFWLELLTATPAKMQEITDLAAAKLGLTDADVIATLKKRQANALAKLVEEKKIKDKGERLDRTYFKPA